MRLKTIASLLGLVLILVAAGACSNPADDTAPATVSEPEQTATVAAELPAGTAYSVAEGSSIDIFEGVR